MEINIVAQKLEITFNFWEWTLCFKRKISIPLSHITKISFEKPRYGRTTIALTFFSNQSIPASTNIKIGNQYSASGPEFWYVYGDAESKFLTLELKDEPYKKIVLELDASVSWLKIFQELSMKDNNLKTH